MKKVWWLAFAILVLISLDVSAKTNIVFSDMYCYGDGSVVFSVENPENMPIYLDNVNIVYKYTGGQENKLSGSWDRNEIYSGVGDPEARTAKFTSDLGVFEDEGDYYVKIYYSGCGKRVCAKGFMLKECKGYTDECKLFSPVPESCTNRKDYFYFKFGTPSLRGELNPYSDYEYYFDSNKRKLSGEKKISGAELQELDDNVYQLKVPLMPGESISEATVVYNRCNSEILRDKQVVCGDMVVELPKKESSLVYISEEESASKEIPLVTEPEEKMTSSSFESDGNDSEIIVEEPYVVPVHFYALLAFISAGILIIIISNMGVFDKSK